MPIVANSPVFWRLDERLAPATSRMETDLGGAPTYARVRVLAFQRGRRGGQQRHRGRRVLLSLGLPASVVNGTSRVGVLAQNMSAVLSFRRHKVLPVSWAISVSLPAMAGAGIGVWAALHVPDLAFRRVLSIVIRAVTLFTVPHRDGKGELRTECDAPGTGPWWGVLRTTGTKQTRRRSSLTSYFPAQK